MEQTDDINKIESPIKSINVLQKGAGGSQNPLRLSTFNSETGSPGYDRSPLKTIGSDVDPDNAFAFERAGSEVTDNDEKEGKVPPPDDRVLDSMKFRSVD